MKTTQTRKAPLFAVTYIDDASGEKLTELVQSFKLQDYSDREDFLDAATQEALCHRLNADEILNILKIDDSEIRKF